MREIDLLSKAWKREVKRQQYCFGLVASITANYSMGAPKEPSVPSDWFPSLADDEPVDGGDDVVTKANDNWMNLGRRKR